MIGAKKFSKQIGSIISKTAAVYILLLALITILRPMYLPFFNENIELQIIATADKNNNALANNVRINHITVNGKDINLANIQIPEESQWEYDSQNDFLDAYNVQTPTELIVQLENVHSLSVGVVKEVGSGIAELYLDNDLWQTIDLYKNADWYTEDIQYETNILVAPEKNVKFLGFLFVITFILCLLWELSNSSHNMVINHLTNNVTQSGALSIVLIMAISIIQYGSVTDCISAINEESQSFLKATVLLFLLICVISVATSRMWLGFFLTSLITVTGVVVSNIKLLNRDVPLLPWDFAMAKEAASVAVNYDLTVPILDILIIAAIVIIVIWLIYRQKAVCEVVVFKPVTRLTSTVIFIFIIATYVQSSFINCDIEDNNIDYRVYQVNNYYQERGFVSAFVEYCSYLNVEEEPDNYNRSNMQEIVQYIDESTEDYGTETPTIIAVMSESFWDIERLDTVSFEEEVLPNFSSLKKESLYGELFTHVLNGGTVTSEFEFLTGFSGEFFPKDYMVYGSFIDDGFDSVVSILKNQGYYTTAIHPYAASNYNRETAYQNLGFDETLFDKDFDVDPSVRDYISDEALFDKITEQYNKNRISGQPQFIFAVTMQNHGGYWGNTIYEDGKVNFTTDIYGDVAKECITDYVAGLHESDRALAGLVDYFRNIDENVIIIYFGDHMSDAGPKDDRMLEQTEWAENSSIYDYETHRVPFIIWSNYDSNSQNLGIMEDGELLPVVFDKYQIKSNSFWNYIQSVQDVYGATDSMLVVNNGSKYEDLSEMTDEQKKDYDIYQLLQYDYIWGKRYAAELWKVH